MFIEKIKSYIDSYCPWARRPAKIFYLAVWGSVFSHNLRRLAGVYGTGKADTHNYATHYQQHFADKRLQPLKILEIGVGGYDDPLQGGSSLRMWKRFFPKAEVFGIDIHDKSAIAESRITIMQGSQNDTDFLKEVVSRIGPIDIVIDDGSHINSDVLKSFEFLFPYLDENGTYVIEDTQTSYWPKYGGDSYSLSKPSTTMGYFKSLVDGLNYEEIARSSFTASYLDMHINSIHFYHNMIFIQKGLNKEGSKYSLKHKY